MIDYKKIREHMVESQIETGGVTSVALLDAFRRVPREEFVPESYRDICCVDDDVLLPKGEFLMEPLVLGRLLQLSGPHEGDIVLNIGDYTGYSSAILSDLVTTIVAIEPRKGMFDRARQVWANMNYCNIAIIEGDKKAGCPEHAPYSLIVLNGAVQHVPHQLKDQLTVGGRLVCVLRPDERSPGTIVVIRRESETAFSQRGSYNAVVPFLKGFDPEPSFSMESFA